MNDTNIQLTIRGLDAQTKQILVSKAKQQGISLNRYALLALKHSAGLTRTIDRYTELKSFLGSHHIDHGDAQVVEDTLTWADQASKDKQQREQI